MQNKSKIRLEIDYLEHQRDYFGVEVGDKLKELNDKLNMEKQEQKFTPGKWYQSHRQIPNDADGMYSTQVYTEDGETIATLDWYPMPQIEEIVDGKKRYVTGTYRDGYARLISAAPELLKVCQSIVQDFENDYLLNGIIVDNPRQIFIDNYKMAKEAVKLAIGEL